MTTVTPNRANENYFDGIVIGFCLSLLGGFLDSYSFLLKGGVFANAQTGNLVLLFISIAHGKFNRCFEYVIPVVTFTIGIFLSELLRNKLSQKNRSQLALFIEFLLIIFIALSGNRFSNYLDNCIISFIAAIQVANFDKVDGNPIATTMITGNLKSSMIQFSKFFQMKEKKYLHAFAKYWIIIIAFGFGVLIGCLTIKIYAEKSILFCIFLLIITFFLMKKKKRE